MRRADRLFQLVQLIRGRRVSTAAFLARRLEVSQRTVYRDVADLQYQGVPVEGEAGVGYRMGSGFDLPPLMFTQNEAAALVVAARMAQSWVDPAMARDIECAFGKILSALPPAARVSAKATALYAPALELDDATREPICSHCARQCVRFTSCDCCTTTQAMQPPSARFGLWAVFTGGKSGCFLRGANYATTFAASGSTESIDWNCCQRILSMNPARRWPICCARFGQSATPSPHCKKVNDRALPFCG